MSKFIIDEKKLLTNHDVANGLETRWRWLEIRGSRWQLGDGVTRRLAAAGEVDMGDELEDDEEADCYHLNKKSEVAMKFYIVESTVSRPELVGDLN